MKKYLLIFLCFFLLTSCSSVKIGNTLVAWVPNESEIEVLPVTADLLVSEQKVRGEATGIVTERDGVIKIAVANALGADSLGQLTVDKPDEFIGNVFTERDGADFKAVVSGYPVYYTNFRTATKTDSLRLNILRSGTPTIIYNSENKPKSSEDLQKSSSEWYFSLEYHFGDGFGWGVGSGIRNSVNLWNGGIFYGLKVEECGILSPWKPENENVDLFGVGGGLNFGADASLPYAFKLVGGLAAGFWYLEAEYDDGHYNDSDYYYKVLWGPFVKLRWHGLEAGLRVLFGSKDLGGADDLQFTLGFTF